MNIRPTDLTHSAMPFRVVIVGGGIAGLSSAWYLQQEALKNNILLDCIVLEQSGYWGGKIQTDQVNCCGDSPFILETGPDAFLTRKVGVVNLASELGLNNRLLNVNQYMARTYVANEGNLLPLPEGMQLLVPTKVMPFLRSPLFSLTGKLRVAFDWLIPSRRGKADETLASFVRRRFGSEVLD